ncbi:MAG: hypothetical protein WCR19_00595, partial [Acholeplasmataceae bacterium]
GLVGFSSAMIKEGFYSGSIDITQVASEFETAAQIRYYVGGLIGKYFGRLAIVDVIRFGNDADVSITTSDHVITLFNQLIAYDNYQKIHSIGVFGDQTASINEVVVTDMATDIVDPSAFFSSEWVQNAFDLINVVS